MGSCVSVGPELWIRIVSGGLASTRASLCLLQGRFSFVSSPRAGRGGFFFESAMLHRNFLLCEHLCDRRWYSPPAC